MSPFSFAMKPARRRLTIMDEANKDPHEPPSETIRGRFIQRSRRLLLAMTGALAPLAVCVLIGQVIFIPGWIAYCAIAVFFVGWLVFVFTWTTGFQCPSCGRSLVHVGSRAPTFSRYCPYCAMDLDSAVQTRGGEVRPLVSREANAERGIANLDEAYRGPQDPPRETVHTRFARRSRSFFLAFISMLGLCAALYYGDKTLKLLWAKYCFYLVFAVAWFTVAFTYIFGFKCPTCRKSLGHLGIRSGEFPRFCPYCGASFDSMA